MEDALSAPRPLRVLLPGRQREPLPLRIPELAWCLCFVVCVCGAGDELVGGAVIPLALRASSYRRRRRWRFLQDLGSNGCGCGCEREIGATAAASLGVGAGGGRLRASSVRLGTHADAGRAPWAVDRRRVDDERHGACVCTALLGWRTVGWTWRWMWSVRQQQRAARREVTLDGWIYWEAWAGVRLRWPNEATQKGREDGMETEADEMATAARTCSRSVIDDARSDNGAWELQRERTSPVPHTPRKRPGANCTRDAHGPPRASGLAARPGERTRRLARRTHCRRRAQACTRLGTRENAGIAADLAREPVSHISTVRLLVMAGAVERCPSELCIKIAC